MSPLQFPAPLTPPPGLRKFIGDRSLAINHTLGDLQNFGTGSWQPPDPVSRDRHLSLPQRVDYVTVEAPGSLLPLRFKNTQFYPLALSAPVLDTLGNGSPNDGFWFSFSR